MAATIGKKELALALGWARTRLDRRLASDPKFPVHSRGDQAGGWAFDLMKVRRYLGEGHAPALPAAPGGKNKPPSKTGAIDKAQLRDAVKPPAPPAPIPDKPVAAPRRSAHHQGEATARQRKDAADAALRENKLKLENTELVERFKMRERAESVFAIIASNFDAMPERLAKRLNQPDAVLIIQAEVDKIRDEMVASVAPLVADD